MNDTITPELKEAFEEVFNQHINIRSINEGMDVHIFNAMFSAYTLGQQGREIPIADYPKDINPTVLRWHHIWKCYVSVRHRLAYADNGCEWIDGTLTNTWPEAAFTPFYQIPSPPQI